MRKVLHMTYGSRGRVHNDEEGMASGNQCRSLSEPIFNHMQKAESVVMANLSHQVHCVWNQVKPQATGHAYEEGFLFVCLNLII